MSSLSTLEKPITKSKNTRATAKPTNHIPSSPARYTLAWVIILTASLFFFYQFIQLNAFNSLDPYIMSEFHLSSTEIGTLSSYFFYANLIFLFPAGLLIDRFSTRKIVTYGMFLCSLSTLAFGLSSVYWLTALARFATGVGSAFCFLACARLASRWFPPQKMAFATGIVVTMAMLGGMVAQTPFALLIEATSWRDAIVLDALLGFVITGLSWLVIRDYPAHLRAAAASAPIHAMGLSKSLLIVLRNPQNWISGTYTALLNLPIFVLGAIWGIMYLSQARGFSTTNASYATTLLFVGVIFGAPAFGWLSDKMGRRRRPMIIGACLSLATVFTLLFVPHLSLATTMTLCFLLGFFTSSQVITYPLIAELNSLSVTSSAISIASFCIMLSGIIAQPLFGWVIGRHWDHSIINGTPWYLAHDYEMAMLLLPLAFVVGLVLCCFIKETYCKSTHTH